jgi:ABC-type multidrug transport system fused ATPase/permease subunit
MTHPHATRAAPGVEEKKRRLQLSDVAREARDLVWAHRRRLALGGALMVVNRMAGLVLPGSSKFLIDDVIGQARHDLLLPLAAAVGGAAFVQAVTAFALSQVLGVAAQRAIADMRKTVLTHVERLPIRFFDSTKSGVLISRIMSDADGVRNLVGSGLVRLTGGLVTAAVALGVLFWLNATLTLITLVVLGAFAGAMAVAFRKLRPVFRERSRINAEVTGRLAESLGGIRVVKAYTAERAERLVFARGVHRLFRNVATTITGISAITAFTTVIIGAIGVVMILLGGRAILAGTMTLGDFVMYVFFTGLVAFPLIEIAEIGTQVTEAFAGLDRIRELRRMTTESDEDAGKPSLDGVRGHLVLDDVVFSYVPGTPVLRGVSLDAAAGSTTALVGLERLRQEHAHLARHGVQPAGARPRAGGRRGPRHGPAARLPEPPGRGAPGQLPVRRLDRREHRLLEAARDAGGDRAGGPHRALPTSSSWRSTTATTRSWASAA